MTPLTALALRILLTLAPLSRPYEALPGWTETPWERGARYVAIATDTASAVAEACAGRLECERTALPALLGVALHESAFAPDVDAGRCYRGESGRGPRCDAGRAVTIWQLQGSRDERALWTTDRKRAAREAWRRLRRSLGACRKLPSEERLAAYASGRCEDAAGRQRARELWAAIVRARAVR